MGFFKKLFKDVKNIFKGIGKIVKKVWKNVKKFASSKLGKLIIAGALIYAGGAAMGAWGGGTASTTATTLASSTVPVTSTAVETAAALESGAAGLSTASQTAAAIEGAGTVASTAAPGLITQAGTAIEGAGAWMQANPALTLAGGQMLSSAFTPSAAEQQAEIDKNRRASSNIAGVYGDGTGTPIDLGLVQRAQQQDLRTPTYKYKPRGT